MIASSPCLAGRVSRSRIPWNGAIVGVPVLWLLMFGVSRAADLPRFREHVVTGSLKQGYQLVSVDLNNDGKKDLIAVDEAATELAWFENPTWERHVLAVDVPRPQTGSASLCRSTCLYHTRSVGDVHTAGRGRSAS